MMQTTKVPIDNDDPHLRPEGMICRGCGGGVKEVPQYDSAKLFQRFTDENHIPVMSFQCDKCEVILSSDELTMGRFVPPHLRPEVRATEIGDPDRPLPLSSESGFMLTVEARAAPRRRQA